MQIDLYENDSHRAQVIRLWRDALGYASGHNAPALVIDKKLAARDALYFVALDAVAVVSSVMVGGTLFAQNKAGCTLSAHPA